MVTQFQIQICSTKPVYNSRRFLIVHVENKMSFLLYLVSTRVVLYIFSPKSVHFLSQALVPDENVLQETFLSDVKKAK